MASVIHATGHGLSVDSAFKFANVLPTDSGVDPTRTYYVLASGLTANDFQFSESPGGVPFILTFAITDGSLVGSDQYAVTIDGVQDPPDVRSVLHAWPEAPGQPQSVLMNGGFKGFGMSWAATTVNDLQFNEVRYAVDDGTGTGPGANPWVMLRTKANAVWVAGLPIDTRYWAQVRAVDYANLVVTDGSNAAPLNAVENPDAGYTTLVSAVILAVGKEDVAFNSVITNILNANEIDATTIRAGVLAVNTSDDAMADGIEIWNAGKLVGYWSEAGLYIGTLASGLPADLSGSDYILLNDAGLTVYLDGVAQAAVTPDGINASAINFGLLPGGHNLILNSSFELADFAPAPATKVWNLTADFAGTQVSQTNTTNTDDTHMVGATF